MKNPAGSYLNAQGSVANANDCDFVIQHWTDNDGGSSFKLTEYVNENVAVSVSNLKWATKYFGESVHVPAGVDAYIITGAADGYVTNFSYSYDGTYVKEAPVVSYADGKVSATATAYIDAYRDCIDYYVGCDIHSSK